MTSRRNFLALGAAGLFGTLAPALAPRGVRRGHAQRSAKNLVIALAYGGWDPMWTIDPKPDSPEVDQIPGAIRRFGDTPIWVHDSRPQVTAFFERWGSISAIVNGVAVESLAHETCIDVTLTGRAGGQTPDIAARVAERYGEALAMPYLALSPQAEYNGHEAVVGSFGATNQLMALAYPGFAWPSPTSTSPDPGLALSSAEYDAVQAYLRGSSERLGASTLAGSPRTERMVGDYAASLPRMERLQANALGGGVLSDPSLFAEVENPFRHAAAALGDGLSQVALVQPNLYWDTHSYNSAQNDTHNAFFGGIDSLLTDLQTRGVLEDTVVLVVSEMGRTPRHNTSGGKDHWPWTSAMVIAPTLETTGIVGTTDEWMRPRGVNLQTGAEEEGGTLLHAEHVLGGVAELLGVSASEWFGRPPLSALGVAS